MTADILLQGAAVITLIAGIYLTGFRVCIGPLLTSMAEVLWVCVGVTHAVWGLAVLSLVLGVIQFNNFIRWRADGLPMWKGKVS